MHDVLSHYCFFELKGLDYRSRRGREILINTQLKSRDIRKYVKQHSNQKALNKIYRIMIPFVLKWLRRKYGTAFFDRTACTNTEDFCTLDSIHEIPRKYFYSFVENGRLYGCDIRSLVKLHEMTQKTQNHKKELVNPYTQCPLNNKVLKDVEMAQKRHPFKKEKHKETIRDRVFRLFDYMNTFGYCTNIEWFLDMQRNDLINWYTYGEDLWNYRANLTPQQKLKIAPKGVFQHKLTRLQHIKKLEKLQNIILHEIESLICSSEDNATQSLGCIYVLTTFTEINPNAALAFPSLVQH